MQKRLMNKKEVAHYLGVSVRFVEEHTAEWELDRGVKTLKLGRLKLYEIKTIDEMLNCMR